MLRLTLAALVLALAPATAATAAGGDCLDESEWDRVHEGMRRSTVHDIVGDNGFITSRKWDDGAGYWRKVRGYWRCNGNGYSQVGYRDWQGGVERWVVSWKNR